MKNTDRPGPQRPGSSGRPPSDPQDLRCVCGSLLARLVDGGIELRCRRCRRSAVIEMRHLGQSGQLEVQLVIADDGARVRPGPGDGGEP